MNLLKLLFLFLFCLDLRSVRSWIYIEPSNDERKVKIRYYDDVEALEGKVGSHFFTDGWHETVLNGLGQISEAQVIDTSKRNRVNRSNVSSLRIGLKFNGDEGYKYIDFKDHVFVSNEKAHNKLGLLEACFEKGKEAHTFISIWTGSFPEDVLLKQSQAICTRETSEYYGFQPIYEKSNPEFTLGQPEATVSAANLSKEISVFLNLQMQEIKAAQEYYGENYSLDKLFYYRVVSLYDRVDNERFKQNLLFCADQTGQRNQSNLTRVLESSFPLNDFLGKGLNHTDMRH